MHAATYLVERITLGTSPPLMTVSRRHYIQGDTSRLLLQYRANGGATPGGHHTTMQ
jgi:hypothetical protein